MSLQSNQLDAFMAVAELLNFTKAADKLHITQSALSQRILNLESELQTTLFIRDRSGLKLTEQAFDLIRYCQSRMTLEDEFINSLKSKNSKDLAGVLKIGGFSSVMRSVIQPSLKKLFVEHPKLKLHFMTKELQELPAMLKRGEIDYMIHDNHIDREELEKINLGFEHNVLVKNKQYSGPEIYLDHDENDNITAEYFRVAKKKFKKLDRRYLDDVYGLLDGVIDCLGLAVLPLHLIEGQKELEIINPEIILKIPVCLYFYKKPFYSKLHKIFIDQFIKNIQYSLDQN